MTQDPLDFTSKKCQDLRGRDMGSICDNLLKQQSRSINLSESKQSYMYKQPSCIISATVVINKHY